MRVRFEKEMARSWSFKILVIPLFVVYTKSKIFTRLRDPGASRLLLIKSAFTMAEQVNQTLFFERIKKNGKSG
jgi:hypothetical protein